MFILVNCYRYFIIFETSWSVLGCKAAILEIHCRFTARSASEGIPQISNTHFQIALNSQHVAGFGWVPFSEIGRWLKKRKRKKEEDRIAVKSIRSPTTMSGGLAKLPLRPSVNRMCVDYLVTPVWAYYSCHFDLDPVTLMYKLNLDIVKM